MLKTHKNTKLIIEKRKKSSYEITCYALVKMYIFKIVHTHGL